ncbi:MAG: hypothetical protein ABIH34_06965 [Nanoarchaeota archaeon]
MWHLGGGVLLVILLAGDYIGEKHMIILSLVALTISQLSRFTKLPGIYWLLTQMDRKKDLTRFPGKGAVLFVIGATAAVMLFPKDIALASIMILSFGDAFGPLVGQFGKIKHP